MRDLDSTNVEAAAYLAREADPSPFYPPSPDEYAEYDEHDDDDVDVHEGCVGRTAPCVTELDAADRTRRTS